MIQSKILIGKPRQYPQELVKELTKLFYKTDTVKAAYIANVFNPAVDKLPHLVVGINMDGNMNNISNQLELIIAKTAAPNELVEIFPANTEWLVDYFSSAEPFYKK